MTAADDFLGDTMPRLMEGEKALHDGEAHPRLAMWSKNDPVTLFGAHFSSNRWSNVSHTFEVLASLFSRCNGA
jgi:hypothetical protein